jgi:hypothetical protein
VHVNTKKIKINTRKDRKNKHDTRVKERVDINPNKSYIVGMKDKIITIKVNGASQGQWSNLLLELNLIRKAWKTYGVDMSLKAPGLKNAIEWGTRVNDYTRPSRRPGKRVSSNQRPRA